jgi:hypothetical protein
MGMFPFIDNAGPYLSRSLEICYCTLACLIAHD